MGLLVTPADTLRVWATEAMRAGFQPATHAIGDRGNRVTLDAYQAATSTSLLPLPDQGEMQMRCRTIKLR
jgi:predicted amidohydrolase YtcJ